MKNEHKESFEQMKIAGSLASQTLDVVTSYIKPGVSTKEIEAIYIDYMQK